MSNYSVKIDDVVSLPIVKDKFTKIKADILNRLRAAIINIETEMGIKPSGKYVDVRTRIDYLENAAINMRPDNSVIRVSDRARPGQTLIRKNSDNKWIPETNFIGRSIKTTGQLESGLINAGGIANGLTIIDGKMIFKGMSSAPSKSDPGKGSIYFSKPDGYFMFSENGSDYMPLSGLRSISVAPNFTAAVDLAGDHTYQKVIGIRTIPIKNVTPNNRQGLVYDGASNEWIPSTNFGANNVVTTGDSYVKSIQITSFSSTDGILKPNSSTGGLTSGLIFDADVNGSADIKGTKIVSNFGNQDVKTTGNIYSDGYGSVSKVLLESGSGPSISWGEGTTSSTSEKKGSIYIDRASGTPYMYMGAGAGLGWKLIKGNSGGPASGHLGGTYPNPKVISLNGTPIIFTTSTVADGYVAQISVSSSIGYVDAKPIKLDGGADYIINLLPKSKQAPQDLAGDVAGKTNNSKVEKLQNIPVEIGPALNRYDSFIYDGSSAKWKVAAVTATSTPSGPANGDLDGYYPSPIVNRINGGSITTKSSVKNINEVFAGGSGTTVTITVPAATTPTSNPSVFAVIPARSFNVTLTITNGDKNILQVFSTDGKHIFGSPVPTPPSTSSFWNKYSTDTSNISGKLITKKNEFEYTSISTGVVTYSLYSLISGGGSGLIMPSALNASATTSDPNLTSNDVGSPYPAISSPRIVYSYDDSTKQIKLEIIGKLKKSLILVVTSDVGTSSLTYSATCAWDYIGNIIPRKGYILRSLGSSKFEYKPLDLTDSSISGLLPVASQAIHPMNGDVSGHTNNSKVEKIQNKQIRIISSDVADGYVFGFAHDGTDGYWTAFNRTLGTSPTGSASNDLDGRYDDANGPKVVKLNGAAIPTVTSGQDGYVIMASGSSSLSYKNISLTDPSIFTGKLPVSRQPSPINFSVDVSGPTTSTKVIRLNGVSIDAPTSTNSGMAVTYNTTASKLEYKKLQMEFFDGHFSMTGRSVPNIPPVSAAGSGTIYFDSSQNAFMVSENSSPYRKLLGGDVSTRKVRTINSSSLSSPIDILPTDDVVAIVYGSSPGSTVSLNFKMPDTSNVGSFDRKLITMCVVASGVTSYTMNFQVFNTSSDIIKTSTLKKSSASFILDKSTPASPTWLYVDSGS